MVPQVQQAEEVCLGSFCQVAHRAAHPKVSAIDDKLPGATGAARFSCGIGSSGQGEDDGADGAENLEQGEHDKSEGERYDIFFRERTKIDPFVLYSRRPNEERNDEDHKSSGTNNDCGRVAGIRPSGSGAIESAWWRQFQRGRYASQWRRAQWWGHNNGGWHNNPRWYHGGGSRVNFYYGGAFGYPFFGYPFFGYPYYGFAPYGYGYPVGAYYTYDPRGIYQGRVVNGRAAGNNSVAAQVQQQLAAGGYYHGEIDGIIGDGTRRPSGITSGPTTCRSTAG